MPCSKLRIAIQPCPTRPNLTQPNPRKENKSLDPVQAQGHRLRFVQGVESSTVHPQATAWALVFQPELECLLSAFSTCCGWRGPLVQQIAHGVCITGIRSQRLVHDAQ